MDDLQRAMMERARMQRQGFADEGGLTNLQKGPRRGLFGGFNGGGMLGAFDLVGQFGQPSNGINPLQRAMPTMMPNRAPMPAMRPEFAGGAARGFAAAPVGGAVAAIERAAPRGISSPQRSAGVQPNYRAAPDYGATREMQRDGTLIDRNSGANLGLAEGFMRDIGRARALSQSRNDAGAIDASKGASRGRGLK